MTIEELETMTKQFLNRIADLVEVNYTQEVNKEIKQEFQIMKDTYIQINGLLAKYSERINENELKKETQNSAEQLVEKLYSQIRHMEQQMQNNGTLEELQKRVEFEKQEEDKRVDYERCARIQETIQESLKQANQEAGKKEFNLNMEVVTYYSNQLAKQEAENIETIYVEKEASVMFQIKNLYVQDIQEQLQIEEQKDSKQGIHEDTIEFIQVEGKPCLIVSEESRESLEQKNRQVVQKQEEQEVEHGNDDLSRDDWIS